MACSVSGFYPFTVLSHKLRCSLCHVFGSCVACNLRSLYVFLLPGKCSQQKQSQKSPSTGHPAHVKRWIYRAGRNAGGRASGAASATNARKATGAAVAVSMSSVPRVAESKEAEGRRRGATAVRVPTAAESTVRAGRLRCTPYFLFDQSRSVCQDSIVLVD